jgi:hypothetical protein
MSKGSEIAGRIIGISGGALSILSMFFPWYIIVLSIGGVGVISLPSNLLNFLTGLSSTYSNPFYLYTLLVAAAAIGGSSSTLIMEMAYIVLIFILLILVLFIFALVGGIVSVVNGALPFKEKVVKKKRKESRNAGGTLSTVAGGISLGLVITFNELGLMLPSSILSVFTSHAYTLFGLYLVLIGGILSIVGLSVLVKGHQKEMGTSSSMATPMGISSAPAGGKKLKFDPQQAVAGLEGDILQLIGRLDFNGATSKLTEFEQQNPFTRDDLLAKEKISRMRTFVVENQQICGIAGKLQRATETENVADVRQNLDALKKLMAGVTTSVAASVRAMAEKAETIASQVSAKESGRMEKLKKLVQISEKLKISQMAQILSMNETDLYDRIVDWASEYGFTIDEDVVKFSGGRKDDFINALGDAFTDWGEKTVTKEGKLE